MLKSTTGRAYGQSEALHGMSFAAAQGETVAIMGRNGMGKTTLFKSLMGMLPLRGRSAWPARTCRATRATAACKGIAYVPQGRMIFRT
jgi:urea transport system ATP-binding protein